MNDTHHRALESIHDDPQGTTWEPQVAEHVARCPGCQKTVEALRTFVGSMRARTQWTAPPELVARVCQTVQTQNRSRQRRRVLMTWVPAALAAGLALGFGLGRLGGPAPTNRLVDDRIVRTVDEYLFDTNHDRYLIAEGDVPFELRTNDVDAAAAWLGRGLGFDVALAEAPDGFGLEGVRLWHTVSRLSALAHYRGDTGSVTVFAVPRAGLEFSSAPTVDDLWIDADWGFTSAAWIDDGLAWCASADLPREDLVEWVRAYRGR